MTQPRPFLALPVAVVCASLSLLVPPAAATAQVDPPAEPGPAVVRWQTRPAAGAVVGQRVTLQLDVLTREGRAQLAAVPTFNIYGAYLLRVESQGTRFEDAVAGRRYSGTRYEWLFFGQRAGALTLDSVPLAVRVISDMGQPIGERAVTTPTLTIDVIRPPGMADAEGLVSTPALDASETWEPEASEARASGAVKRTITLHAVEVPGMALPPLPVWAPATVRVYPATPVVEDVIDRQTLAAGTRTQTLTYVFERPGRVGLPPLAVTWWNTAARRLETTRLPGRVIVVNAGGASRRRGGIGARRAAWLVAMIAACFTAALAVRRLRTGRRQARALRRGPSEAELFWRFRSAAAAADARRTLGALMRWLDAASPAGRPVELAALLGEYGDPQIRKQARGLVDAVLGRTEGAWDPAELRRSAKALRARLLCVHHRRASAGERPGALAARLNATSPG
jgi:hypothetical protein